jgi:hypothetical protein
MVLNKDGFATTGIPLFTAKNSDAIGEESNKCRASLKSHLVTVRANELKTMM